jgi:hypothetical protein
MHLSRASLGVREALEFTPGCILVSRLMHFLIFPTLRSIETWRTISFPHVLEPSGNVLEESSERCHLLVAPPGSYTISQLHFGGFILCTH